MSIETTLSNINADIERLNNAKSSLGSWLAGNGVSVPSSAKMDDMVELLDGVETGGGAETIVWLVVLSIKA